jgi:uncharacterized protein
MKTLQEHLAADGTPKRILSLDGGGIRGIITLAYLERIEKILRDRHKNPNLVLSDYFDLIGGTSTGAIIATALALGHDVAFIREKYEGLGRKIFKSYGLLHRIYRLLFKGASFDKSQLVNELSDIFGDETLDSKKLKTGLGIVARRTDTGSTWIVYNREHAFYKYNKDILLRTWLRASAAAPTYFDAERINVENFESNAELGWFVDGGVSMHNNPALLLLFTSTLRGYEFNWTSGSDKLMLVSVGTGWWRHKFKKNGISVLKMADIPSMLMDDSSALTETVLQIMSKDSPTARKIDSLYGELKGEALVSQSTCHYLRYNLEIESDKLRDKYGIQNADIDNLREMSKAENVDLLLTVGRKAAEIELPDSAIETHFPTRFDL